MEHKIIGSIVMGILSLCAIVGGLFLGRWLPLKIPAQKSKLMLLVLAPLLLVPPIAQYYLGNFLTDGKTSIRGILVPDMPPFALFISVWIGAYIKQKPAPIAEEKAATTLK